MSRYSRLRNRTFINVKKRVKVKYILEDAMKTQKGSWGIASSALSLTSALDGVGG